LGHSCQAARSDLPPRLVIADKMSEDRDPNAVPLVADESGPLRKLADDGISPCNLYRALANHPALLEAWTDFAWRLRRECQTPRPLRELIILRAAQLAGALYIWQDHVPMALEAGVERRKITELAAWSTSGAYGELERTVLRLADELIGTGHVCDATLAILDRQFSPAERIELTLTAAFYAMVPRALDSMRVPLASLEGQSRERSIDFGPAEQPSTRPEC
jgi:alkylhydroperoxidase family enzyme